MSLFVIPFAVETPSHGHWPPHAYGDMPKMLILCQDAHPGDMSFLVSLLSSLGTRTGQKRTSRAICLYVSRDYN
jgi:hypothetical protein